MHWAKVLCVLGVVVHSTTGATDDDYSALVQVRPSDAAEPLLGLRANPKTLKALLTFALLGPAKGLVIDPVTGVAMQKLAARALIAGGAHLGGVALFQVGQSKHLASIKRECKQNGIKILSDQDVQGTVMTHMKAITDEVEETLREHDPFKTARACMPGTFLKGLMQIGWNLRNNQEAFKDVDQIIEPWLNILIAILELGLGKGQQSLNTLTYGVLCNLGLDYVPVETTDLFDQSSIIAFKEAGLQQARDGRKAKDGRKAMIDLNAAAPPAWATAQPWQTEETSVFKVLKNLAAQYKHEGVNEILELLKQNEQNNCIDLPDEN